MTTTNRTHTHTHTQLLQRQTTYQNKKTTTNHHHHAPWTEGIQLIKEHDARRARLGACKQLAHRPLALSHKLVHQLRALDGDEVGIAAVCQSLGKKRLTTPRGPIQQNAWRLVDTHSRAGLRRKQRELDCFLQLPAQQFRATANKEQGLGLGSRWREDDEGRRGGKARREGEAGCTQTTATAAPNLLGPAKAPMSSQLTDGVVAKPSRVAEG